MDVYMEEELDLIEYWIENILDNNKVMELLHAKIRRLKDQAWEQFLEAEKHYSDAYLDIFEDYAPEKLILVEVVVQRFQIFFDEVSNDEDIW